MVIQGFADRPERKGEAGRPMNDSIAFAGAESSLDGCELPPVAPVLMQSLRSVGYTTSAAIADLVDNSIAANAKNVRIFLAPTATPHVAFIDDGCGMDASTLINAMRFGSRDPREARAASDLGRFGLGLKTASLSQCRRLTVASFKDGRFACARWDLDVCERTRTWWLERPKADELPAELLSILESQGHGTLVLWEDLDRLTASGAEASIIDAADHLALAFHRFLAGEIVGPFSILLNDRPLPKIDPFLEGHTRGQSLHEEAIKIDGHTIRVSPFVLPFPSRLKETDLERAGGRESLRTAHGFYIYRGSRLVVPGGWFRIVPSDDLIRLARIRIDVPIELDHLWKVDIRKAIAEPPPALRPHLKRIVGHVTVRSRKVYQFKGLPAADADRIPIWLRHDLKDQGATWKINREHPYIQAFLGTDTSVALAEMLLRFVEDNLPIQDIHIHTVNDQPVAEIDPPDRATLADALSRMLNAFKDQPDTTRRLLEHLEATEPFNRNPEAARQILEGLQT